MHDQRKAKNPPANIKKRYKHYRAFYYFVLQDFFNQFDHGLKVCNICLDCCPRSYSLPMDKSKNNLAEGKDRAKVQIL